MKWQMRKAIQVLRSVGSVCINTGKYNVLHAPSTGCMAKIDSILLLISVFWVFGWSNMTPLGIIVDSSRGKVSFCLWITGPGVDSWHDATIFQLSPTVLRNVINWSITGRRASIPYKIQLFTNTRILYRTTVWIIITTADHYVSYNINHSLKFHKPNLFLTCLIVCSAFDRAACAPWFATAST